jgi:2-keto-4-pentenoate hydratase
VSPEPHVRAALREQLRGWRAGLDGGATRVGWKIGFNLPSVREQIGLDEPVIGHLTSKTLIEPGGEYRAGSAAGLVAEPEVAVQMARDVAPDAGSQEARDAIAAFAPAIEVADIDRGFDELEPILAENIFHRAVVLGERQSALAAVQATVLVNGEERAAAQGQDVTAEMAALTARLLGELGERLCAGDWIITGTITAPVPVTPGDELSVDFGGLGRLELSVT